MEAPASEKHTAGLQRYLSPLGAIALAFGCAVGWGSFVMPGSTFLPIAGPVGTVIGIAVGAMIMLIIAVNYYALMNRFPEAGGAYSFTKRLFGYDHGFLCAWFLLLTYIAIIWANATALPLIARNLLGGTFKIGWHYTVAGFEVYEAEAVMAILSLGLAALLCFRGRLSARVQIGMAALLFGGILVCIVAAVLHPSQSCFATEPAFAPGKTPLAGVFTIIALSPWAFVGFESISHSAQEFHFPVKKSLIIMAIAVVMAGAAYALLALLAVSVLPEGCASWTEYIDNLGSYSDIRGLPTFHAANALLGSVGTVVLGLAALGGIITGLIGNYIASSRLIYAMAEDEMLPRWFGKLSDHGIPRNAIVFLFCLSAILPFFGRTAVSWIVDVTTVGATIAYAYVSSAALREALAEKRTPVIVSGVVGLLISLAFMLYFLIPNLLSISTLSTESYLILSAWSILGFVFFLYIFKKDKERRFGRSTVSWVVLLALIIVTSTIWMDQATDRAAAAAVKPIQSYYTEKLDEAGIDLTATATKSADAYLADTLDNVSSSLTRNSLIQTGLVVVALVFLFHIYSLMQKREKQIEVEKVLAEENSRAKTSFLSNMSHEIRTPMNAIIGLDTIALKDPNLPPQTREQLEKIGASATHLLGLINDILDMSRIESGRMVLKEEEFALRDFLNQINVIIGGQCAEKGLNYDCRIIGKTGDYYVGDGMKLKQVLINILGNAVKFTPAPGTVTFTMEQTAEFEGFCTLRFVIKDTGIGMSKEYIPKIFEAFSQEDSGATNKYGSTGLGMAITKNLVQMMNGDIEVESEKGVGTTFFVKVTLKCSSRSASGEAGDRLLVHMRALIVDDDAVACEHAKLIAGTIGVHADYVMSGEEALALLKKKREQGEPYDLLLTDYKMPGMNGIELARALREVDGGETIVIVLTGYSSDDMRVEASAAGVDSVMSKPLFTDSLAREIRSVMEKRNAGPAEEAAAEDEAPAEGALEGLHVLIAEDMEINAEILTDLLELEGVTAEHAENGQIAVEMFAASEPHQFDAVLMDVRMPVMDGLEATRGIRALDREDAKAVPIIAMTANAFDDDVQRSLQAGMSAHLSKPVEPERLYETLRRLAKKDA